MNSNNTIENGYDAAAAMTLIVVALALMVTFVLATRPTGGRTERPTVEFSTEQEVEEFFGQDPVMMDSVRAMTTGQRLGRANQILRAARTGT